MSDPGFLEWLFPPVALGHLAANGIGSLMDSSTKTYQMVDPQTGAVLDTYGNPLPPNKAAPATTAVPAPMMSQATQSTQMAAAPQVQSRDWESWAKDFSNQYFNPGSFGRLSDQPSAATADILARRQANLSGLNSQENTALREGMVQGVNQGEQTAMRQLRGVQGAQGIRGGLAGAQQADVLKQAQQTQAQNERDLFLQNVLQRQQALNSFEGSQQAADAAQRQAQTFNLSQGQGEKQGAAAAQLAGVQMGQADATTNATLQALSQQPQFGQTQAKQPLSTPQSAVPLNRQAVVKASTPEEEQRRKQLLGIA